MSQMRREMRVIVVFLALVMLSACVGFNSNMKIITSGDFDFEKRNDYTVIEKPVNSKQHCVIMFTTYVTENELIKPEYLLSKAIKDMPEAVGLVDARYEIRANHIPLLFTWYRARISSSKVLVDSDVR